MFEEINQELDSLHQGFMRYQKTGSMLNDLTEQFDARKKAEAALEKTFEKEDLDLEKISKTSVTSLFYTLLGSREQQVEKERQEALAAKLKLDQCRYELQDIQARIEKLNREHAEYSGCEQQYNELLRKKHDMLLEQHGKSTEEIIGLENQLLSCKSKRKEIDEAISAGNNVIRCTGRVSDSLNSAQNWGTWDLLGGGLISDLAKHSHIDDARAEASNVSVMLSRFQSELADVKIISDIHIDIGGFTKFADFFFDGLIADWVVQSRIHDSQASVAQVEREVHNVLYQLTELKKQNDKTEGSLSAQLTELIAKS